MAQKKIAPGPGHFIYKILLKLIRNCLKTGCYPIVRNKQIK